MLIPDVVAEVLRFFDRRYLTKLQLHGRGLRDIVDAACSKYPLASLRRVTVRVVPPASAVLEMVNADYERIDTETVDFFDAVRDVKLLLQKAYVDWLEFCAHSRRQLTPITKRQWNALVSAVQCATVDSISLNHVDLTDVEADQVKRILNASCLKKVVLEWCRVRSASVSDAFLTLCRDNGVNHLIIFDNELVDGPSLSVTEEAIFDYCFRADGRHGTNVIMLRLSVVHANNSFRRRLIKMMEGSQSGRRYDFGFFGLNALPDPEELRQYEVNRSNTGITFKIPFSHNSRESFHDLHYTCE